MEDEKNQGTVEASAAPSCSLLERLSRHLRQVAPHQMGREQVRLLEESRNTLKALASEMDRRKDHILMLSQKLEAVLGISESELEFLRSLGVEILEANS